MQQTTTSGYLRLICLQIIPTVSNYKKQHTLRYSSVSSHQVMIVQLDTSIAKSRITLYSTQVKQNLYYLKFKICSNSIKLERVSKPKLLGITIDEHLRLSSHTSKLLKNSYIHLSVLKKLRRYTSQSIRKQLVELLIFSRLDYCNNLFIDIPQHQIRIMIKLQTLCASFLRHKFCFAEDILPLKWLLVPEQFDFTVLKMIFKEFLNNRMPSNFQINIKKETKLRQQKPSNQQ